MKFLFLTVVAYLIGSIPTAYILMLIFKQTDIRKVGSGNPGTTNVIRTAGIPLGIITFIIDFLKGYIPVAITKRYVGDIIVLPIIMFIVVVGHTLSVFLFFRGGKGVATFFGAVFAISPSWCLSTALVFIIVFIITHVVSISSLISVTMFLILGIVIHQIQLYKTNYIFFILTTLLIILRHKSNIKRLITGQEQKLF